MKTLVIDIDNTLVDTDNRRWSVWCHVLGREISFIEVTKLGSEQILDKYALGNKKVWQNYWRTLFCWDEYGIEALKFDKPIPFASKVLRKWEKEYSLVYLTGRSANMRKLTLKELKKFDFPTADVKLVMLSIEDWEDNFASKTSHVKLRARLFSLISNQYEVVRVVDDYPLYFTIYRKFKVPDRIGLLYSQRFSKNDYYIHGSTREATWKQLWNLN